MQRFVIEENIRRFRKQLEEETAPDRRRVIQGLLEAEEAKLVGLDTSTPSKGTTES